MAILQIYKSKYFPRKQDSIYKKILHNYCL